ncbi:MAG: phage portal protein [Paenibacillaceae bacterium]|nr:phage portal protein [Paenibacillaceae bacterium]
MASGDNRYEIVLQNSIYLRELAARVTLEDSLDEIACRANIELVGNEDLRELSPGQEIRISGTPFGGTNMAYLLHPGVVWEAARSRRGIERQEITVYEKTIYLAKSEDEYLFPAGQSASQRLKQYASDWQLPVADIADTEIPLAKAVYRSQSIYSMMMADLKETAMKGGDMFRVRMSENGIRLIRLGSNEQVWMLEDGGNVEESETKQTLEGVVTQVKVLGVREQNDGWSEAENELPLPVVAVEKGDTASYGTLQKVMQMDKQQTTAEAVKAARGMISGVKESMSVTAIDINTLRAGDLVQVNGAKLLVVSVRHEFGTPGHMQLELSSAEEVRRKYYYD